MTSISEKKIGCVKWFNSTRGYGFITNIDNDGGNDFFVHHTGLVTQSNVYKTLTPGEYVEYEEKIENNKYFAINVTGIRGGKLLCENKTNGRENLEPSELTN